MRLIDGVPGRTYRVTAIRGPRGEASRLRSYGLQEGSEIEILHILGPGFIIKFDGMLIGFNYVYVHYVDIEERNKNV